MWHTNLSPYGDPENKKLRKAEKEELMYATMLLSLSNHSLTNNYLVGLIDLVLTALISNPCNFCSNSRLCLKNKQQHTNIKQGNGSLPVHKEYKGTADKDSGKLLRLYIIHLAVSLHQCNFFDWGSMLALMLEKYLPE